MARDPIAAAAAALVTIIQPVATDPRRLKPGELCRILNSTPLGPVIDDRRLRNHRNRAGTRIGDGKTIDLLRYAGWLGGELHAPPIVSRETKPLVDDVDAYERKKIAENERNKKKSESSREIGELPPVKDPARRAAAEESLQKWCDTYLTEWFFFGWSPDLAELAAELQIVIESGGQLPCCMPRGGGKSTIGKAATLFGILKGCIKFGVLIGAIKKLGVALLRDVKTQLLTNDKLAEDYPEVCVAVRKVGNIANRCNGLTYKGEPTGMEWGKDQIVLPKIRGSQASGAIICASGLDGAIRGLNYNGQRPDFAFGDDPQTKKSAKNPDRVREKIELIEADVRGLSGPDKVMKIYLAMTVICQGDAADQLLDPELHPDMQGKRYKLLYAFPTNMELWREYRKIQETRQVAGKKTREETKFYLKNRAKMDAGAHVAWEDRKPGCESALQYAMDLYFQNETTFNAEYQNQPGRADGSDIEELDTKLLRFRLSGRHANVIPNFATTLVGHIDVQHHYLHWGALACDRKLSGDFVAYGTWPDQGRDYYQKRSINPKLGHYYKGTKQAQVKAGLIHLLRHLLGRSTENWPAKWPKPRVWKREDGVHKTFELILVDCADGNMASVVYEVCRMPEFAAVVSPAAGRGIGAKHAPMELYPPKEGELKGHHWLITPNKHHQQNYVVVDTNYWKTDTAEALMTTPGNPGSLVFFGEAKKTDQRLLADHCTAERRERVHHVQSGRIVDEWALKPGNPDNEAFDNIVGCRVAASIRGCSAGTVDAAAAPRPPKKKRRKGHVRSLNV